MSRRAESSPVVAVCSLLTLAAAAYADTPTARFDGVWTTILACAPSDGALPYTYEFTATVSNGVLHAERGVRDTPGWLETRRPHPA